MASPPAIEDNAQTEKVAFRFCHEWYAQARHIIHTIREEEEEEEADQTLRSSNMLYPREDKMANKLVFQCRNCNWSTNVGPTCIYRNELSGNVSETAGVIQDVASDPTVGDPVPEFCTLCGEAILCPTCNQATDGGQYLEVDHVSDPNATDVEKEREEREQAHPT